MSFRLDSSSDKKWEDLGEVPWSTSSYYVIIGPALACTSITALGEGDLGTKLRSIMPLDYMDPR